VVPGQLDEKFTRPYLWKKVGHGGAYLSSLRVGSTTWEGCGPGWSGKNARIFLKNNQSKSQYGQNN
jgi:hypothetical protein